MTLRALYVVVLSTLLAALAAGPASADVRVGSVYKNSATKRLGPVVVEPVAAPRTIPGPTAMQLYTAKVLMLTNEQRTNRGLRPLAASSCADQYAQTWAGSLAALGSLVHQSLRPILTTCRARSVGENIAYGSVTPEALVGMWMGSPGHRANILNPGFTHLGVGATTTASGRVYAVQDFLTL